MLIDGEKVIDFMFEDEEHEDTIIKSMRIIDFLENYSVDTVPTIEEPKWIPIDQKPKVVDSYLCYEKGGFYYVDTWYGANWGMVTMVDAKPIAYMPIPKPTLTFRLDEGE